MSNSVECALSDLFAGVLWDMDGTLVDSEPFWGVAFHALAERLGGILTADLRDRMVGESLSAVLSMLFTAVGREPTGPALAEALAWLEQRARETLSEAVPWRPGAREALSRVRSRGAATALVTNTRRVTAECVLGTLGRHNFDVTVCGDEVPRGKPAPDVYLRAAELLGLRPSDCLAVEDSAVGAAAAEAAGCWVLVVPSGNPVPAGPRRIFRESLFEFDDSRAMFEAVRCR